MPTRRRGVRSVERGRVEPVEGGPGPRHLVSPGCRLPLRVRHRLDRRQDPPGPEHRRHRTRRTGRRPGKYSNTPIQRLISWQSNRRQQIEDALRVLTARYEDRQGHAPGESAAYALARQAADWARSPKRKELLALTELRERWRTSAIRAFGVCAVNRLAERAWTAAAAGPGSEGPPSSRLGGFRLSRYVRAHRACADRPTARVRRPETAPTHGAMALPDFFLFVSGADR